MGKYSKVLVTGGAGFIGSHLVEGLLSKGYEVTVLDNFSYGKDENISGHVGSRGLHVIRGDIRDSVSVKRVVEDVDAVFHEAGLLEVALSVREPLLYNDVNVVGTLNLLNACLNSNVSRFVFASSGAVYGDLRPYEKREDMFPRPTSPYGVSKLAAENYVRITNELHGLETVSLRYFNVYGPRQSHSSSYSGVVIAFINQLLHDQPPIIYGDGMQTRDFVSVDDVVSANMLAMEGKNAVGEVFNVGTNASVTVLELAKMLQEVMKKGNLTPVFFKPRVGDVKHCSANISKAEALLGFKPRVKLKDGISRLVEWYLAGATSFKEEPVPKNVEDEDVGDAHLSDG